MSGEWERLVDSAALVRRAARINLACVKKKHGCNYTETAGQRDGSLFATAWTLLLSESENGIYLPQRKETTLPFCPFVSQHVPLLCSYTLLLWPHFFQDTSFLLLMATQPNCPIFHTVLQVWRSVAAWHALRGEITWLKQMTNADSLF